MRIPRILSYFLIAVLAFGSAPALWAQAGTGELTGLVTDPTAAVLSGAKVELTNSQTGLVYTTQTSTGGIYRFVALPVVGTYTLALHPAGFKAVKIAGIVISVGTTVTQDIKLELGTAGETVTVEADAELVQASHASVSGLVDRRIWESMPLEVRNQNSFIELVAGSVQSEQKQTQHRAVSRLHAHPTNIKRMREPYRATRDAVKGKRQATLPQVHASVAIRNNVRRKQSQTVCRERLNVFRRQDSKF